MNAQILAAIGETGSQTAASLNAGLAANDRIAIAVDMVNEKLLTPAEGLARLARDNCRWQRTDPSALSPSE
jgi:hypothetical protein